jgi:serine O-acetyltransferase
VLFTMLDHLRADAAGYLCLGGWWRNLGFWVGAVYRLGSWAKARPALVRYPFLVLHALLRLPIRFLFHVEIPAGARIGKGLVLQHPFSIFIPAESELGEGVTIFHEVTIGNGPLAGVPKIGNGVVLFVGARVLGGITIGDRTEVGANCVVTRSVPPDMVVVTPLAQAFTQKLVRRTPVRGSAGEASVPGEQRPS